MKFTEQKGVKHACEECKILSNNIPWVKLHIRSKHQMELRTQWEEYKGHFNCIKCEKGLGYRSKLEMCNQKAHRKKEKFECVLCQKQVTKRKTLKQHLERVHDEMIGQRVQGTADDSDVW